MKANLRESFILLVILTSATFLLAAVFWPEPMLLSLVVWAVRFVMVMAGGLLTVAGVIYFVWINSKPLSEKELHDRINDFERRKKQ